MLRSTSRSAFRSPRLPILLLLPALLTGCAAVGPGETDGAGNPTDPEASRFRFTYAVTVPAPPAGTRELHVWVPLPYEDPGVQSVADLEIEADVPHQVTTEPEYGNRMVHVRIADPAGAVRIAWSATVTRHVDAGQGSLPNLPRYLRPDARVPLDGMATDLARKIGALDPSLGLEARAKRIYDDVLDGMVYDKSGTGWGLGDFRHAVEVCQGNCTDFHARFTGVARAAGIPVRFTMGIPLKKGENTYNSYHCWAHWYDGEHWRPVDISEADKIADTDPEGAQWFFGHLGSDRIGLTFGRDITLSPPQRGEKLNYFVFPWAEADGKPLALDRSMWLFSWTML
jgi:transglutaminase-like putative cysteine protease